MTKWKPLLRRFTRGDGSAERKVMDLSLSDGVLWSVYSSITSYYLVPITIFILGVKDPVGLIVGIPFLIVPLAQLFAYKKAKKTNDLRKTTLLITLMDRILWLPLVFFIFIRISFYIDVLSIILILSIRTFFASFSGTTWTLWVPFLISPEKRNRYFSLRNSYMKVFSLIGLFIGTAIFATNMGKMNQYALLIIISLIFSSASLLIMRNIPTSNLINESAGSRGSLDKKFILFLSSIGLFILVSSGFVTYFQYFLIDTRFLHLSLTLYSWIMIIISISYIVSQIFWGRIANIIGNAISLTIGMGLFVLLIVLLVFFNSIISVFASAIILGIVQSNTSLNIFNEMLKRASAKKVKSVSSYNTIQSLAQGGGPIIGNALMIVFTFNIHYLFISFVVLAFISLILFIIYTSRY